MLYNSHMEDTGIVWVEAHKIGEAQTRALADTWKSSNPQPRNWAMGFTGSDEEPESPLLARLDLNPTEVRRARLLGAFRK
jgi:hypothetical protein